MQKVRRPQFGPPVQYGPLTLPSRYLLSPLAGYTNLPFRLVVRELGGVGLATTDLVNARGLLAGSRKTLQLIETSPEDKPFAVQIFGQDCGAMCAAAQLLEGRGVDSIDINMGCPVERITKGGAGASMMQCADETISLVHRVVESVRLPVTVKMRLGWDSDRITAPQFAREFEQVGVAGIAIHGRTRAQGFRGVVDLAGIRRVVEAAQRIPVIGNGDICSIADAARMLEETGCHGVSIGRGALSNPWIFRQLVEWEVTGTFSPAGTFDDRLELLKRQFSYLERLRGADAAIILFRRMGHWYLKAMGVRARLRNCFQQASSKYELEATLAEIFAEGPVRGSRTQTSLQMHISVPSGPVERW
jgi:nifR3 family TIM-barrel protein